MHRKSTQAVLAIVSLAIGLALPAVAQAAPITAQKGAVTSVELKKADGTSRSKGMCRGRFQRGPGAMKPGFRGPIAFKGGFSHGGSRGHHKHHSLFSPLRGEFALTTDQLEKIVTFPAQWDPKLGIHVT